MLTANESSVLPWVIHRSIPAPMAKLTEGTTWKTNGTYGEKPASVQLGKSEKMFSTAGYAERVRLLC